MAKSTTSTEVAPAAVSDGDTTAALAARRRTSRRSKPDPTAVPTGQPPAPVAGEAPVAVIASRTLVSSFSSGGLGRPIGGVWTGKPLVIEVAPSGFSGVIPHDPDYVVADCDAQESMVPWRCYTPVNRTLWRRGMRVRKDLYDAVMAAHRERAEAGEAHTAPPAELPAGADALPADVIAGGEEGQPTAGTDVAAPIIIAATGNHVLP